MSIRLIYCLGLIAICAILGSSLYLQFFLGIIPCPLCTFQRIAFGALGLVFLLGILLHRHLVIRQIFNVFGILFAVLGAFFAGRQIWIQYFLPTETAECGVSLQYMMKVLPWHEVIQKVFAGSAECIDQGWTFLMLSMPEWALIWFIGFIFLGCHLLKKR